MIVFDLKCDHDHRFEAWFRSSEDFAGQQARGLVECPHCGSLDVVKAPMAPFVGAKGNTKTDHAPSTHVPAANAPGTDATAGKAADPRADRAGGEAPSQLANTPMPAEVQKALGELAKAQAKALEKSTWVGTDFAKQSREMHYGERDETPIHGQASLEEAKALVDEGVSVAPLPFPVAPPEKLN